MTRKEKAMELRGRGYNCAQAVICSFSDVLDVPEETLFAACEGFGTGMGNMQQVCGAVSGAVMLAGLKNSTKNLIHPDSTGSTLRFAREITKAFEEKNQTVVCKELKGIETGKVLRSCQDCILDAIEIAEEVLKI